MDHEACALLPDTNLSNKNSAAKLSTSRLLAVTESRFFITKLLTLLMAVTKEANKRDRDSVGSSRVPGTPTCLPNRYRTNLFRCNRLSWTILVVDKTKVGYFLSCDFRSTESRVTMRKVEQSRTRRRDKGLSSVAILKRN